MKKNIESYRTQVSQRGQGNSRALRVMEDLQRSIQLFNNLNVYTPKFGYSSINFSWKNEPKQKDNQKQLQYFRNGLSQRNSVKKKTAQIKTDSATISSCKNSIMASNRQIKSYYKKQQKEENCKSRITAKRNRLKFQKRVKRMEEEMKTETKQKRARLSLFSIRNIKGIVFRKKNQSIRV